MVVEITNPNPLMDLLFSPQVTQRVSDSDYYKDLQQDEKFRGLLTLVSFLEARFGKDWKELLADLAGGGITLALGPEERSLAIIESRNESLLNDLHTTVLTFSRQGPNQLTALEHSGVTGWVSKEGKVYTVIGNRIIWANDEAGFRTMIDHYTDPNRTSLSDLPAYQEAVEALGNQEDGRIFLNLRSAAGSSETEDSLLASSNPLDVLFSAGVKEYLRQSRWAALGIRAEEDVLRLRALTADHSAFDSSLAAFARPRGGIPAGLRVKHQILGSSFYRDLQSFYAAKDELFPERTSGLIFFENMMGIFFSGRDFTDEILAELGPTFQMVAARQIYDANGSPPTLQLPAFAVVFEMVNPATFSAVVEEAWQKALGLLNFTRGQQAQPGLIIDRADHRGVKYSYAYFAEPDNPESRSETRFNFRPALAMPGNYLILSSTDQLARDLIEATMSPAPEMAQLDDANTYLEVDFNQLTKALGANREALIQQNMLKEGNTRQKAEDDVSVFLLLLQQIFQSGLQVGWGETSPWSELEIRFESN
jgi:hypothetical protein